MSHLTESQGYTISSMLSEGFTQTQIAEVIRKNRSIVSREIRRNRDRRNGVYKHDLAQRKSNLRHRNKSKQISFTDALKTESETLIREVYSSEQVVNILKQQGKPTVSVERIYQHIWQNKKY